MYLCLLCSKSNGYTIIPGLLLILLPTQNQVIMESKRQSQVAEMIKRNFSLVLQDEGSYIYKNALVTVTQVSMSPDLSYAKIYLSVYNRDDKAAAIQEMNEGKIRLRRSLGTRIRKHIRRIPEIDFFLDDTLDEMYRLNNLFDEINNED